MLSQVLALPYIIIIGILLIYFLYLLHQYTFSKDSKASILTSKILSPLVIIAGMVILAHFLLGLGISLHVIVSGAVPVIVGASLLSLIFHFLIRKFNSHWLSWLNTFYYVGIAFVIIIATAYTVSVLQSGQTSFLVIFTASVLMSILVSIGGVLVTALALLFSFTNKSQRNKSHSAFSSERTKPDMMSHYRDAGLSPQEIENFRSQMAQTVEQIKRIEVNFQAAAKLRAIEVRYNVVKVSQNYFRDIVEEPNRQLQASTFLISLLPQLDDLLIKYNEINSHVAKNKQTYLILERSAQSIELLSQKIVDNYIDFHASTYQDLEDGIKLADRTLKRHQNSKDSTADLSEDWMNDKKYQDLEGIFDENFFDDIEDEINKQNN